MYPQRSFSGQAVVTGLSPSPLRYESYFFSRILFSIPTFQLLMLLNFHRISYHLLARIGEAFTGKERAVDGILDNFWRVRSVKFFFRREDHG